MAPTLEIPASWGCRPAGPVAVPMADAQTTPLSGDSRRPLDPLVSLLVGEAVPESRAKEGRRWKPRNRHRPTRLDLNT